MHVSPNGASALGPAATLAMPIAISAEDGSGIFAKQLALISGDSAVTAAPVAQPLTSQIRTKVPGSAALSASATQYSSGTPQPLQTANAPAPTRSLVARPVTLTDSEPEGFAQPGQLPAKGSLTSTLFSVATSSLPISSPLTQKGTAQAPFVSGSTAVTNSSQTFTPQTRPSEHSLIAVARPATFTNLETESSVQPGQQPAKTFVNIAQPVQTPSSFAPPKGNVQQVSSPVGGGVKSSSQDLTPRTPLVASPQDSPVYNLDNPESGDSHSVSGQPVAKSKSGTAITKDSAAGATLNPSALVGSTNVPASLSPAVFSGPGLPIQLPQQLSSASVPSSPASGQSPTDSGVTSSQPIFLAGTPVVSMPREIALPAMVQAKNLAFAARIRPLDNKARTSELQTPPSATATTETSEETLPDSGQVSIPSVGGISVTGQNADTRNLDLSGTGHPTPGAATPQVASALLTDTEEPGVTNAPVNTSELPATVRNQGGDAVREARPAALTASEVPGHAAVNGIGANGNAALSTVPTGQAQVIQFGKATGQSSVNKSDSPTPASAASTEPIPVTAAALKSKTLSLQLEQTTGEKITVQFAERGGEMKVAVNATDSDVARALRQNLSDLSGRLSDSGYQGELWRPAETQQNSAGGRNGSGNPDHSGDGGSQGQSGNPQQGRGQEQQSQQRRPQWIQDFKNSLRQDAAGA